MWRGYGFPYRNWRHGMRWMNRGFWRPGMYGWGYRRPCCCCFFALPLLALPFLALAAWMVHII